MREQSRWMRKWTWTLCLACGGVGGCANMWDTVTSNEFRPKHLFKREEPLVVLKESTNGDARARAMRKLKEPARHNGTDHEQDMYMKLLASAASTEKQAVVRLAAVQRLGESKDPRAVKALEDAYFQAKRDLTPDLCNRVQCATLTAMGSTGNREAIEHLSRVVREPAGESTDDQRHVMDCRIAAARALANFKDYDATEALYQVIKNDKDVALRDLANDSLRAATGRKLPPDPKAWDRILHPQSESDLELANQGPLRSWIQQAGWTSTPTSSSHKR